jgi:hypothetical protein
MSQPLLYDPRYHTFESWACAFVRAVRRQSVGDTESIHRLEDVGQRVEVYRHLRTNEAVPDTDNYQNWYDWAEALLAAINPRVA